MKKILFINFNCAWNTHFEIELDIMRCNMDKGEDVYSLSCRGVLNKFCALAYQSSDKMVCDLCKAKYNKYYEPTGLFEGTFMGVNLNKSYKFLSLVGKIKRFGYKQRSSLLKRIIK